MYGVPFSNQRNGALIQRALVNQVIRQRQAQQQALQQEQQRRVLLLQQQQLWQAPPVSVSETALQLLSVYKRDEETAPTTSPSDQPLVMTDLKPEILAMFQKIIKEHAAKYRETFDKGEADGDGAGKAKAEPIVSTVYEALLKNCTEDLKLGLPPKERLIELIRSSLGLVNECDRSDRIVIADAETDDTKIKRDDTKIKRKKGPLSTKPRKQTQSHTKDMNEYVQKVTLEKPKRTCQRHSEAEVGMIMNLSAGTLEKPKRTYKRHSEAEVGMTMNLSAMRRYREALASQQQEQGRQREAANLFLLQQQQQRQQQLMVLKIQQQQQQQHRQQQILRMIQLEQEQARRVLANGQVLDPISHARMAQGILDRQKLLDANPVSELPQIAVNNWNNRNNIIRNLNPLVTLAPANLGEFGKIMEDIRIASESATELETETTPTDGDDGKVKGSKMNFIDLSKDETEPAIEEKKPLKNKAKKPKRNKSNTTKKPKSSNGTTKQPLSEPLAFADLTGKKGLEEISISSAVGGNTDISEYAPQSDGGDSLGDPFSMMPTTAPTSPPPQQQPPKTNGQQQQSTKANKWNVEKSNLSAAAKRRLKELAPFNSAGNVTEGECDFDSVLGFTEPENDAIRRSRRTRQHEQPASVTTVGNANGRKRKRPLPMARKLPTKLSLPQEKFEPLGSSTTTATLPTKKETKKEVTTGALSIPKKKADAKTPIKKNQHAKNSFEQNIRKKLPLLKSKQKKDTKQVETSKPSCLSEEKKDGDSKSPQKAKDIVEVVYSAATRRKLIDRKRRRKSQKSAEKSSSLPAQRPSRDLMDIFPELSGDRSLSTSSKPKDKKNLIPKEDKKLKPKEEKKVSPPDGVIPSFLPASVQKALKELAPHNTPGKTTAGDNSFILNNALYDSQSGSRGRRSSRDKKKINYNENDALPSESRGRRRSRQKATIKYIESEEEDAA